LQEIQAAAVDSSHPTSDLLRKCQILASRLRHDGFKQWVANELGGYTDRESLPPYRANLRGQVKAQLSGPFGSGANNVDVPVSLLPKGFREDAERFDFFQGVATLETLIVDARDGGYSSVHTPLPPELYARIEIYQGYSTVRMWSELPVSSIAGVLDQVRSRALAFTLEIEAENPSAGDEPTSEPPVPVDRTNTIFLTQIYGGNAVVGQNPSMTVEIAVGDVTGLMNVLVAAGVSELDRDDLIAAIRGDTSEHRDAPGPRVSAWLGKVSAALAASGARVGEQSAAGVVAVAIAKFLGLG
jgi:hypothetical protein